MKLPVVFVAQVQVGRVEAHHTHANAAPTQRHRTIARHNAAHGPGGERQRVGEPSLIALEGAAHDLLGRIDTLPQRGILWLAAPQRLAHNLAGSRFRAGEIVVAGNRDKQRRQRAAAVCPVQVLDPAQDAAEHRRGAHILRRRALERDVSGEEHHVDRMTELGHDPGKVLQERPLDVCDSASLLRLSHVQVSELNPTDLSCHVTSDRTSPKPASNDIVLQRFLRSRSQQGRSAPPRCAGLRPTGAGRST